jgi:hypothetical protein
MTHATCDRGEILHFAGFHHLSPALSERGDPALSAATGDGLTRCGWEPFFAAMGRRGLAASFDPEDPSSVRFVPARHRGGRHPSLAGAVDHARRFWKAMFPRPKAG